MVLYVSRLATVYSVAAVGGGVADSAVATLLLGAAGGVGSATVGKFVVSNAGAALVAWLAWVVESSR